MTGCSVRGCSNSREKGFLMKTLPTDPDRRRLWLTAINRPALMKSKAPALCEVHFDNDCWEMPGVGGKRKLKDDAMPTLFLNYVGRKQRDDVPIVTPPPNYVFEVMVPDLIIQTDMTRVNQQHAVITPSSNYVYEVMVPELIVKADVNKSTEEPKPQSSNTDHEHCNKLYDRCYQRLMYLKKKLKAYRAENKRLRALTCDGDTCKGILNDAEIEILEKRYKRCEKWSKDTLEQALWLKLACGNAGYTQLRKQNIPLPSLQTLAHMRHVEFDC
ncbi:uncharacterized protein LOC124300727 [Neodiprion virginianus]|uniref:Uncharacterized protein LOC107226453 n=1 Tax=Neodiprion lecontei TaxID=441921 RepID=A0A6J0C8M9_NEOLC|nr:uncharacterized protein LOC107226453 [Neodiprion lecontei]XP_046417598.1 uncharacterized protein LOC124178368 [Neodiprion fabricii]XP_046611017.1 uncharacterized protein LOC124300727 [Neodiprion virginianus]